MKNDGVSELWAVMKNGRILYSRGGSSTRPKLMVYSTESQAKKVLKNPWIKQIIKNDNVEIKCIYRLKETS